MHSIDILYRVEPRGNGWTVTFCGQPYGSYERRIDAMRSAAADAHRVRNMGHHVTVEVTRPAWAGSPGRLFEHLGQIVQPPPGCFPPGA